MPLITELSPDKPAQRATSVPYPEMDPDGAAGGAGANSGYYPPLGRCDAIPGGSGHFSHHPGDDDSEDAFSTDASSVASGLAGHHSPFNGRINGAEPVINTSGLRQPEPDRPGVTDSQLDNMNFNELQQEGSKRLASATEAYTNYAKMNIAQQARQALDVFIQTCATHSDGNVAELVSALKAIALPAGMPTDLSVTIQYPGQEAFSLILPSKEYLSKAANTGEITKWYNLANQAMGRWSDENIQGADALAIAKQKLDDVVASLKAVREATDRRMKEMTGQPGNSQLEVKYQEHVDRGVSIHFEAKDDLIGYQFGGRLPEQHPNPVPGSPSSEPLIPPPPEFA